MFWLIGWVTDEVSMGLFIGLIGSLILTAGCIGLNTRPVEALRFGWTDINQRLLRLFRIESWTDYPTDVDQRLSLWSATGRKTMTVATRAGYVGRLGGSASRSRRRSIR